MTQVYRLQPCRPGPCQGYPDVLGSMKSQLEFRTELVSFLDFFSIAILFVVECIWHLVTVFLLSRNRRKIGGSACPGATFSKD